MVPPKKSDAVVKTNPDPTEAVKEALTLAIKNLDDKLSSRLSASESAVTLARQELKDQLLALETNIGNKFLANKDLVDQLGLANKAALEAALLTQKEMANKSEANTAESAKATNEKIDRLTSRLDTGDGRVFATGEGKQDRSTDKGQTMFLISIFVAIGALALALIPHLK